MQKQLRKPWTAWTAIVLAASVALAGCSTTGGGGSGASSGGGSAAPSPAAEQPSGGGSDGAEAADGAYVDNGERLSVTMMNVFLSNTAPDENSPIVTETERITNTDLDITYVPFNVYTEKLNVTLTSGEMPQVIMVENPFTTTILKGIEAGMFWDLTPYLDEFPNLKNYDPQILDNLSIGGKYYVVPRPRPLVRLAPIIRKDWLDHVGLAEPTTVDEFYNLLVAFKEKDPDGNGKHDTYGIMFYENSVPADIFAWFGAPNNWKVDADGNFVKDAETAEYKEGLNFVRKLYEEGLLNANFPITVRNEARKDLYNNRVGVSIESIDAVVPFYYFQQKETKNEYEMTVPPPVNNTAFAASGHYGGSLISKTSVKTEDELKRVLAFFNRMNSEEARAEFVRVARENNAKPAEEQFNLDDLKNLITTDAIVYPVGETDTDLMLSKRMAEYAAVSVPDPSQGLISPTETEKSEQLKTILQDARTKYILGEIDEAGYDAMIAQWKSAGGEQVAKEYAELYKNK